MLIREKLILSFTLLSVAILMGFSIAIYSFYSFGKDKSFHGRLSNKAFSIAKVFAQINKIDEIALHSLDQQREAVYDENNKLIYSSGYTDDLYPTASFLDKIRKEKEVLFTYKDKGGFGLYYTGAEKKIVVIVTGLDKFGIERINSLKRILIIGNLIGLITVVLAGFGFSKQALKPVKSIITQVHSITGSLHHVRIDEGNKKDEIASLAIEFNKLLDRVEETMEAQKSFVSHASHELRTPLANILGTLETSYTYDKDITVVKQSIQSSIEELKKIIELTNGLLNLAKVESDPIKLKYQKTDVLELILDSVATQKTKYPNQEIEFSLGKLDDESIGYIINGNKYLVAIALSNILDNACKYSDNSRVLISLDFDSTNNIILTISDKGYGISEENLDNIFHALYRGDNVKNIPGYGIGLALADKIVKLHDGRIIVTSEINNGTKVTIIFPSYITIMN